VNRQAATWKQKIDPHFDELIKFYLQFLELTGLPSNSGWIVLGEEAVKLWEDKGMRGWIRRYEKEMTDEKKTVLKWKFQKNMTDEERNSARRDFRKWLLSEIKDLPEDSREYYKREFSPFLSDEWRSDFFENRSIQDLKEVYTDLFINIFLIVLHTEIMKMRSEFENSSQEEIRKRYIKPDVILDIVMGSYNSIALLTFGKTFTELIKEAGNGSAESFFSLLQIDRTAVECGWAQKMIRKAQLTADESFFKRMAKAISTSPLENDKEYTAVRMVVLLFWRLGLRKLTNNELIELLEECGLKLHDDPESFRRFVNRLIDSETKRNPLPITLTTSAIQ
jgi:hypothetical protein